MRKGKHMMMKMSKIVALCIATLLLLTSCGSGSDMPQLTATDSEDTTPAIDFYQAYDEIISESTMKERGHISSADEYLSEISVGFNNADGSKTVYVYSQAVNYKNEYMEWTRIDTGLTEVKNQEMRDKGYIYTISASNIMPFYPAELTAEQGIRLQKNLYQFGIDANNTSVVECTENENFTGNVRDMLVYKDAMEGADMYVYPSTLGTNVEFEITQSLSKNLIQLWIEVGDDMQITKQPSGYLTIMQTVNGEDSIVGVIQKPLLKGSDGTYSYESSIRSIRKTEGNRYSLTFTIDEAMNKQGTTAFIAFEVRREKQPDNCLYSKKPNQTHAFLSNYSVIGNSEEYGIGRLMIRYILSNLRIDPATIQSAYYQLYSLNTDKGQKVQMHTVLEDWCSITGNWNSNYKTGNIASELSIQDHEWIFDITNSVREWYADEECLLEYYGLQLRYANENSGNSIILSNDNSLYQNVTVITFMPQR